MPDASPADAELEGQEPELDEGQEPELVDEPDDTKSKGRTYDEAYVRQLRRENATVRTRATEAEAKLAEREDADKTEVERLTDRAAAAERAVEDAEQRAADAELKLLRFEVAAEAGLDPAAVQFLTGSSREELEHRADELAKLLTEKGKPTAGGFDGGARGTAPDKGTPEQEHNRLLLEALGRSPRRT
jgi:hypothetical protein